MIGIVIVSHSPKRAAGVLELAGQMTRGTVPMEAAECLQQGRPERDWTIVPRAGHWVQYESAEAVNTLVLGWLGA